jgi:hypothetical protein
MLPTDCRQELREKIERDIQVFFAKGGKVKELPPMAFTSSTVDKNFYINSLTKNK